VKITRVQIRSFRNIKESSYIPNDELNGFWGENGQGKTNYLEALYASFRLKSFRPYCSKSDWFPSNDEQIENSKIQIDLIDSRGLEIQLLLISDEQKRWKLFYNGKKASIARIRELIPIIVFSPDDHSLIRGGPEGRREFIDELFTDVAPGYGEVLSRYQRTIKQRNELLKRLRREEIYESDELINWTRVCAREGAELCRLREELWPEFKQSFLKISHEILGERLKDIHISFHNDVFEKMGAHNESMIFSALMDEKMKDIATGWTHRGPHRDDFLISIAEDSLAKTHASQSQARLLALALKWTHAEFLRRQRDEPGIFLIDDLSSELDAVHRDQLFSRIIKHSGQLFLSGTEHSLVDLKDFSDYTYWEVQKGRIQQLKHGKYSRISTTQRCL